MIKLSDILCEIEYPLATGKDLQSYQGEEGWKGKIVWMHPDKFLRMANPIPSWDTRPESMKDIEYRIKNKLPLDFCVLVIDMEKRKVTGHEGRHRATVAKKLGIDKIPVLIYTGSMFRRVPKWNPEDHEIVNRAEFKPEWDKTMNEKLQLNEANKDEAALEFLKKMVQSGPFRDNVYLAGGAVRDMEMGNTPKDLDVVVTNFGKEGGMKFATWLAQQMGNYKEGSNPVLFPTFGTAKVVLTGIHNGIPLDGMDVEAVFARKEVYTPGSRKPEVFPGTIEDDAFRRDFTTNSLMMNLTTGEILDITGKGKADIKAGIIRTTSNPNEIFGQDALRVFRAVRFATKYGWKIDPETIEGIKNNLDNLSNTSKERVRDELDKIIVLPNADRGFRLLRDLGLLPYVAPEFQKAVGMTQNIHHTDDVFDHSLEVLIKTNPTLVRRWMALCHDIGKVVTRSVTPTGVHFYGHEDAAPDIIDRIMRELKYPTEFIEAVKLGAKNHMRLKAGKDEANLSDKTLRKFKIELGQHLEDVLDVIHADNISHADASAMPNQIERVRQRLKSLDVQVKKPTLPINGNDLLDLGIRPGPKIGQILGAITDAWYENPNISRDEALSIAKGMMR